MNKAQQIRLNRANRHKKRRKNKSPNINPYRAKGVEADKQLLKAKKIRDGKLEKIKKATHALSFLGRVKKHV